MRRRERQQPDYPVDALRQFAYNAIMHRSYEGTNTPVRVYWYADRIEIASPGGLYGRMTRENFGTGDTDYRNPLLAEIMHHLGFAQRFGLGVPLARRLLAENGNPDPEFHFEPARVVVAVRTAGVNCITVFNNKDGVGKTSLVYHLAWMYAELDYNVLVADLDPQAHLTSMFLDDDELEKLWARDGAGRDHIQCTPAPARRDRRRHHAACGGTGDRHRARRRRHAAVRRRGRAVQPVAGLPRRETSGIPRALCTVARHANGGGRHRGRPHSRGRRPGISAHSIELRW